MSAQLVTRARPRTTFPASIRARAGFTLLEILLVLGLIGLLTSVLVVGINQLTADRPTTPEEVFWQAIAECRKQALLSSQDVTLMFSDKEKPPALAAAWKGGGTRFPFENASDLKVDFLAAQKGGSAILLGGQLVETKTVPHVTFYADGTCSSFRAQFKSAGSEVRVLTVDPWTCAPVLPDSEKR